MSNINSFIGTGVALVTPFLESGAIDYISFEKLIEHVIHGGVDYLVPLGSTGEASTISPEEQQQILHFVVKTVASRKPIVAGCFGGNNTKALLQKIKGFDLTGIDALLSASPAYNKPSQEGIFQHFKMINDHSTRPVIMYNVPGRTSSNVEAKTSIRIANECKQIFAIKEASGNLNQIRSIIEGVSDEFLVISGDDPTALETVRMGGKGVISVIGNVYPNKFTSIIRNGLNGMFDQAELVNKKLDPIHEWLYIDGNPSGIKAALNIEGICNEFVRLPLVPMQKDNLDMLASKMV